MARATGDKRQQILAAAVEIFAARGFYRAKIADIATAAGVGKGTVYEYFRSKKDLFQQLLLHLFTNQLARLQEISQEPALGRFLGRLFRENLDEFLVHREIARILLSEHPPVDAAIQQLLNDVQAEKLRCLKVYLRAARARGEMRPLPSWLAAHMILGFIAALGHRFLLEDGDDYDPDAIADLATAMILKGISS